ncbi:M20/M25/M40 family metallo-hydrolase [uncultured Chloroflexus sp.]|uniref:M20/M25/M40 family metallo-hydrolase n=1 Tax=uncultured Chloroflexus sp. TaxID=214040 RepID=UPI00261A9F40|nr:M20/M25/M40 family metallo-hydrolase [uncultured Chloroflexus sp.]
MRLVPLQAPHEIAELVHAFLQRLAPPSVTLSVEVLSTSHPVLVDYRHPAVQAASDAFTAAFDNPATFTIDGGTLPIAATFQTYLCAPLIITGFGLPDDNLHAPNEKIALPCLFGGSEMVARYLAELAAIASSAAMARAFSTTIKPSCSRNGVRGRT